MKFLRENSMSLILFAGMVALSCYYYPQLPESIPTKFDYNGNPTQLSSREFVALFMPGMYLFLIFFIGILVKASPEKFSMPNSKKSMDLIIAGCGLLFLSIHLSMVVYSGERGAFIRFFSFGIALFLIVVGNVFGKVERNFFMGIRVPWTIASEANWRATHRFGGKMMVIFGLGLLIFSFFYSSMLTSLAAILIPTLSPAVYSYLYYKKNEMGDEKVSE